MKNGSNTPQVNTDPGSATFADFSTEGNQQSLNIAPFDVRTNRVFEQSAQCSPMPSGEVIGVTF